ncbi:MAG: excisionase family DNA-binding protein [Methylococcus sp.]|nr:excisionase family DNA-binding protein [Methylococcus sp.]
MELEALRQALLALQSDLKTVEKAAEDIGLTKDTVRGWVERGEVKTVRVGRRVLINMLELRARCLAQVDLSFLNLEGETDR